MELEVPVGDNPGLFDWSNYFGDDILLAQPPHDSDWSSEAGDTYQSSSSVSSPTESRLEYDSDSSDGSFLPLIDSSPLDNDQRQHLQTMMDASESRSSSLTPPSSPPRTKPKRGGAVKRRRTDEGSADVFEVNADGPLFPSSVSTMTSSEFEGYLERLGSVRAFSPSERSEIKRQRRLVKNRESAQASRLRKKEFVDELHVRLAELEKENAELRTELDRYKAQTSDLNDELSQYRAYCEENGLIPPTIERRYSHLYNGKTAGIVVMMVLFSFGLMFGSFSNSPSSSGALTILPVDTSSPGRIFKMGDFAKASFNIQDDGGQLTEDISPSRLRRIMGGSAGVIESSAESVQSSGLSMKQCDNAHADLSFPNVAIDWNPNTTYLYCGSLSKLEPPAHSRVPPDQTLPLTLSFLLPPYDLHTQAKLEAPDQMLEVSCQVAEVRLLPIKSDASQNL